jgi:hypothetical protein
MGKLGLLTATLASGLSGGLCLSEEVPPSLSISEEDARTNSAGMYSHILRRACLNGHRYSWSNISRGFERHYQEYKLGLAGDGYTIIPMRRPASVSQVAFDANRRQALPPQLGCHRAYWLDNLNGVTPYN